MRYQCLRNELQEGLKSLVNLERDEFILAHPDLSLTNLFIDPTDYEVTCIIDWELASTVPVESFYIVPHLPDPHGPLDSHLRSVFIDAFESFEREIVAIDRVFQLHNSESM